MTAGLGLLRLPSHQFWRMTPREIACALEAVLGRPRAATPPSRRELLDLMRRFPDT